MRLKKSYVLLAMALGLMIVNVDFALAATSDVFGSAKDSIGGGDAIGELIRNIINTVIRRVWYISIGFIVGKNIWDMTQDKDIWKNVKDIVVGIAISTLLLNVIVPAVVNIGNTAGTQIESMSKGGGN